MATTPSKITREDDVPAEIQERVARYMLQWEGYLTQDRKYREGEIFYTKQLREETKDLESRQFFKSKLATLTASRRTQKELLSMIRVDKCERYVPRAQCHTHQETISKEKVRCPILCMWDSRARENSKEEEVCRCRCCTSTIGNCPLHQATHAPYKNPSTEQTNPTSTPKYSTKISITTSRPFIPSSSHSHCHPSC